MFKRIVLGVATFALIGVLFLVYQWREDAAPRPTASTESAPVPPRRLTTRPASTQTADQAFSFRGTRIPPGQSPQLTVFDEKGNAKTIFQATAWDPISDNEFSVTQPTARLLLPGGQLAYVWADAGQVTFQRGEGSSFNPKSGWLRGHVRIFIDRTKPKWRKDNPDRADLEQHPEAVVKIWLDDVSFDLDRDRIDSDGSVVVQSTDATIEGEGLELVWNEVDRRIRLLRIAKGKRATLRSSDVMDFGLAGGKAQKQQATTSAPAETPAPAAAPVVAKVKDEPEAPEGLSFQDLDDEGPARPKDDRVDTYQIEIRDNVIARQMDGAKVAGQLRNVNLLELICDIGREERSVIENAPGTQPAGGRGAHTQPSEAEAAARLAKAEAKAKAAAAQPQSTIELEWTGELVAKPIETTQPQQGKAERFHLIANGTPLEVKDPQNGDAVCHELEYHGETKQVWLRGAPGDPVDMQSGSRGRLSGDVVFYDPKTGIARVDGAGRMVTQRQRRGAEEIIDTGMEASAENGEIVWTRSAQLEFARTALPEPSASTAIAGAPRIRTEYIKRAVFDGQVRMNQTDSSIGAEHIEAVFAEPDAAAAPGGSEMGLLLATIVATGKVDFQQRSDRKGEANHVTCDRLEVDMDTAGRSLPRLARAFGNVVAVQGSPRGRREIRAQDRLTITMASVPRPITPAERQQLELIAAQHPEVKPGSPKWVAIETKLNNRRRTITRAMTAGGNVSVRVRDNRDSDRNLNLIADSLDCTFREDGANEDIDRALIVGRQDRPASVEAGDIFVKGPQISIDMTGQTLQVPGEGIMRFLTKEDLDGRPVAHPVPVVVSWKDRMAFRGKENRGSFVGSVRAASATTLLDARELRIEFETLPPAVPAAQASAARSQWIFGPLVGAIREDAGAASGTARLSQQMRKRPVYLWAVGDAVMESSSYDEPIRGGVFTSMLQQLPQAWQAEPAKTAPERGRLISRLRAAGPQIRIDLVQRHFGVEGAGNMSIEDYRLPQSRKREAVSPGLALAEGRIGGLDSLGPSQTVFTWQSSMTYLNNRNLAVFDDGVRMNHVAGGAMVMQAQLAAALKIDPKALAKTESRQARLECENLLVEFSRDRMQKPAGPSPLSRATRLQRFEAKGGVQLMLEDGRQSVTGTLVTYNAATGDVRITGSPSRPAQILEQDERTAKLNTVRAQPGKAITWNEITRIARVEGSSITATGR